MSLYIFLRSGNHFDLKFAYISSVLRTFIILLGVTYLFDMFFHLIRVTPQFINTSFEMITTFLLKLSRYMISLFLIINIRVSLCDGLIGEGYLNDLI
jgi:hypothetical protein